MQSEWINNTQSPIEQDEIELSINIQYNPVHTYFLTILFNHAMIQIYQFKWTSVNEPLSILFLCFAVVMKLIPFY